MDLLELEKEILTFFNLSSQFELNYTRTPIEILKEKCKEEYNLIKKAFRELTNRGLIIKKEGKYYASREKKGEIEAFLRMDEL
jgi:hypothetical protein